MFSKIGKLKKSFIGAIGMSLILLLGSSLGFLLETNLGQITKPTNDVWTNYTARPTGSGTSEANPYKITTPQELAYLINNLGAGSWYIELASDIDLGGHEWVPIKTTAENTVTFKGNGHTISNLIVDTPNGDNVGLFGGERDGVFTALIVSDLNMSNVNLNSQYNAGAIIGSAHGSRIENINILSGEIIGARYVGGIVGAAGTDSVIINCNNSADIYGTNMCIGGIAGESGAELRNCVNTGDIYAETAIYVGSIAGYSYKSIDNCYGECSIYGAGCVGGISGRTQHAIKNSGFRGSMYCNTTPTSFGSFISHKAFESSYCYIENCFSIANIYLQKEEDKSSIYTFGAPDDVELKSSYSYMSIFVAENRSKSELRKYKVGADETEPFKEMAYDQHINGGYPFPKSLFAVGQYIQCDTLGYLQDYMFNYIEIKNDGSQYYIEYGQYPQTYVGAELNNTLENAYNSGTILEEPFISDPAEKRTAEVYRYNGQLYARLEDAYVRTSDIIFQNGEVAENGKNYWFKFEPIKWRILNYTEYMNGAPLMVIAEKVLNVIPFNSSETDGNSWAEHCLIREWLNGTFCANVFERTGDDKIIMEVEKKNNSFSSETDGTGVSTMDKIWILSVDEVTSYFSSQNDRIASPTDYSLVNFAAVWGNGTSNQRCYWWLRTSKSSETNRVKVVNPDGGIGNNEVYYVDCPVRPAMTLNI